MRVLTTIQIWCYIHVQGIFVITKYGHCMLQYVTISSRFVTNVQLGVDMGYRVCKTMYIVY